VFSCGLLTDICKTIGINFTSVDYDTSSPEYYEDSYLRTDTFVNQILFKLNGEYDCEAWAERVFSMRFSSYNSCFATSKAVEFKNYIDTSTFKLSLDQQITYENNVIQPNTDLFGDKYISGQIIVRDLNTRYYPVWIIGFSDKFYQKVKIDKGYATFNISCFTNDSLHFVDSVKVYIDI
jgi:hypothetical protein